MSGITLWALLALLVAFPGKTGGVQEPGPVEAVPEQAEAEDTAAAEAGERDPDPAAHRALGAVHFRRLPSGDDQV